MNRHPSGTSSRAAGDLVVGRLMQDGLLLPRDVRQPELAAFETLARFHSWSYIESAGRPETIARVFGTDPGAVRVDTLMRSIRRAVGGTVEAACNVVAGNVRAAVNLGGGFHHAEPEMGAGFCLFNDVGVAIRTLRAQGFDEPIMVIDLDVHQGNGNSVAFSETDRVHVYSVHGSVWSRSSSRAHREIHLQGGVSDARYMAVLRTTLVPWLVRLRPGLVFYIAGADILAGDRLGSFWVTLPGVFERDRLVTEAVRDVGAGLVVTMGGGYSRDAWLTHYNYARYLLTGTRVLLTRNDARKTSFDRASRALDPLELQKDPEELNVDLSPEELFGQLTREAPARRLLDFYSRHGIEVALQQYGLVDKMKARGYDDVQVTLDIASVDNQRVLVDGIAKSSSHRLVELVVRRGPLALPGVDDEAPIEALWVEWLLLQDPLASFSLERPRLPGQNHPGLGLARDFVELLIRMCKRLGLGALVDLPAHYHNGAAASPEFHFVDPEIEGRMRAMMTILTGFSAAEGSQLVEDGRLVTREGEPVRWQPAAHVLGLDARVQRYFRSDDYRSRVIEATNEWLKKGLQLAPPTPTKVNTSSQRSIQ
ncbi:MAG: histone deacetylase [Myxococcales bacterium]|nr:histone deacetylase [Myxococcales bacterium]